MEKNLNVVTTGHSCLKLNEAERNRGNKEKIRAGNGTKEWGKHKREGQCGGGGLC